MSSPLCHARGQDAVLGTVRVEKRMSTPLSAFAARHPLMGAARLPATRPGTL
ncbi:hypothetical protein ACLRDC_01765 [Gluconacetobacter sacchari]|uniref:hypothetical protein n=1 Tax=Gluconacetobacter sacchari TaxID=92759 RepID=UPI0039B598B4